MTWLPRILPRLSLTLARSKDFPNGSMQNGYDLIAPLDSHPIVAVELTH